MVLGVGVLRLLLFSLYLLEFKLAFLLGVTFSGYLLSSLPWVYFLDSFLVFFSMLARTILPRAVTVSTFCYHGIVLTGDGICLYVYLYLSTMKFWGQ